MQQLRLLAKLVADLIVGHKEVRVTKECGCRDGWPLKRGCRKPGPTISHHPSPNSHCNPTPAPTDALQAKSASTLSGLEKDVSQSATLVLAALQTLGVHRTSPTEGADGNGAFGEPSWCRVVMPVS